MYTPLEHVYIGLTDAISPMESSEMLSSTITTTTTTTTTTVSSDNNSEKDSLNLEATELTLGLPGSHQIPKTAPNFDDHQFEIVKDDKNVHPFGVIKSMVSGAKRGFCDTVDIGGSGKCGFNGNGGTDGDLVKNGGLFSPRVKNGGNPVIGSDILGFVMPLAAAAKDTGVRNTVAVREKVAGPASKEQVVGWPPIRSFRKNTMATNLTKNDDILEGKLESRSLYVKVGMDGAPYLRKLDLQTCRSYLELSTALEKMFSCFTIGKCGLDGVPNRDTIREGRKMDLLPGSECVLTFEDKDGDWMLVGDVPWEMFTETCKRLRIMKSSEAIGLAPKPMEKRNKQN